MTSLPIEIYLVKAEYLFCLLPYEVVSNLSTLSVESQLKMLFSLRKKLNKEILNLNDTFSAIQENVERNSSFEYSTILEISKKMYDSLSFFLSKEEHKKVDNFSAHFWGYLLYKLKRTLCYKPGP